MIEPVSSFQKALSVYSRQQFYADRTAKLNIRKTTQAGVADKVTLSPRALATASHEVTATAPKTKPGARDIAYDDPRKTLRAKFIKSAQQIPVDKANIPENGFTPRLQKA